MRTAILAGVLVMGIATREHIVFKPGGHSRMRFVEVCDSGDCVWIKSWSVGLGQEVRKKRATIYTTNEVMDKKTELRGMKAN